MKHTIIFFTTCLLLLSGCRGKEKPIASSTIAVSIEPIRFLTEQIAGDRFQVFALVPKGSSPENYEPTPQQIMALADSKAFFLTGKLSFEKTQISRLQKNATELLTYDLSDSIRWIKNPDKSDDPHIWMSPKNAQIMARNICRYLCELDSAGTTTYQQNLKHLQARIDSADNVIRKRLAPLQNRTFFILHPALAYFAHDYGLRQLCVNEGDKEPSPGKIQQLIKQGNDEKVRVFFVQEEFSDHTAKLISNETKTHIIRINPLAYDWLSEVCRTAQMLLQ